MQPDVEGSRDAGDLTSDDAVASLREAGDHPLMYAFPDGAIFAFDRELRYLSAGGRGLADVGLSREALEGRTIFEAFPEETVSVIEPFYRDALDGDTTQWTCRTKDGPTHNVSLR